MTGRTKSPGVRASQPVSVPNGALAVHVSTAEGSAAKGNRGGGGAATAQCQKVGANSPRLVQRQEIALRCVYLFHPVDVAFEHIPIVDRNIALGLGND